MFVVQASACPVFVVQALACFLPVAALSIVMTGCQTTETGAYAPSREGGIDRNNYETTVKVALMDRGVQNSVTVSDLETTTLPDGRMQVAANVRNRENRRIQLQANCEFKDEQGLALDSTPWQTLILTENSMETIQFASMNRDARRYTIRLREAR
jgi:uncharacterized protein YcfL